MVRFALAVPLLTAVFILGHRTGTQDGIAQNEIAQKPLPRKVEYLGTHDYQGRVTGITKTTVTLTSPGWRYRRSASLPLKGEGASTWEWVHVAPEPFRQFRWSRALVSGGPPGNRGDELPNVGQSQQPSTSHMYHVEHLQVGDIVHLEWCRVDGVDVCDSFGIVQRPGGKIPPCPGDEGWGPADRSLVTEGTSRYHERAQAVQDWVLDGKPLPEWLRDYGRHLVDHPYPPAAPAPRSVVPLQK